MKKTAILEKLNYYKGLLLRADDKASFFYGEQERIKRVIAKYEAMLKESE